jgi:hypothetical protein
MVSLHIFVSLIYIPLLSLHSSCWCGRQSQLTVFPAEAMVDKRKDKFSVTFDLLKWRTMPNFGERPQTDYLGLGYYA